MRKLMTKLVALTMVFAIACSLVAVSTVSVSAADETIELIGEEKSKGDMYGICKEGASKNKFSVVKVSDLKAGEVEYKGPATNAYYAEIGNSQDRDGMGIDFNTNIDVSGVTDGRESRYMIDMWLWIEDVKKLDILVLRAFESQTYKTYATVGKEKVECLGEYRLFNQTLPLADFVNGWNHVKIALPAFGRTDNDYEKEAFEHFRTGDNKKTICSISIMNRAKDDKSEKKLGDYAIASMRITTLKQIKADYPEEYPDEEGDDANDLTADGEEVESETILTKIAKKEVEKLVKVLQNEGTIDVSKYDAACQEKVRTAAQEAGVEIADLGNGQWTAAGGKNDTTGGGSDSILLIVIIAAAAVLVVGGVVVLLVVLKKKKAAAVVAAVEPEKDEDADEEEADEE